MNAMYDRGYAMLMEYRLAKLGITNAFTLCGTPEYLAPEQVWYPITIDFIASNFVCSERSSCEYKVVHAGCPSIYFHTSINSCLNHLQMACGFNVEALYYA